MPATRPVKLAACTTHQTVEEYRCVASTLDANGRCVQCVKNKVKAPPPRPERLFDLPAPDADDAYLEGLYDAEAAAGGP